MKFALRSSRQPRPSAGRHIELSFLPIMRKRPGACPAQLSWRGLEDLVRGKVQEFIQEVLEAEVTEFLGGREKSQRKASVEGSRGVEREGGRFARVRREAG